MASDDESARNRWATIQAMRLSGAGAAILGLLITADVVRLPHVAGYIILAFGLLDVFVVPALLARKWRTPRP